MAAMTSSYMLVSRLYHSQPPQLQTRADMNPTLLVSWWCTGFALAAIVIRVSGRYVRTERLFQEDKVMFLSIIPLLARMALVHVILLWGTNNTTTQGLTALDVRHREVGSKLVLVARILYAAFIWTAKFTVLEFLKRLVGAYWRKSYEIGLLIIRYFLLVAFAAVVIATLVECHPFCHYWQVIPDPGPKCREGLAQLITMGTCDIITDLLLVIYPIPIVLASAMPMKRKVSLTLLFALSLGLVAITAYRVPSTITKRSSQQYRSLLASLEILAAAAVSNSVVIGSFIRDRGTKKAKYKMRSASGSTLDSAPSRKLTLAMNHHWGSDSDLVASLGMSFRHGLHSRPGLDPLRPPPPVVLPIPAIMTADPVRDRRRTVDANWTFFKAGHSDGSEDGSITSISTDLKLADLELQSSVGPVSPGAVDEHNCAKMSFFDVGSLLQQTTPRAPNSLARSLERDNMQSGPQRASRCGQRAFMADVGGLLSPHREAEGMDRSIASPPAVSPASWT